MFTAVGFDLDDTLAVTSRDRRTILAEATEAASVRDVDREEYLAAHEAHAAEGDSRAAVFRALVDEERADDAAAAYRGAIEDALEPVTGAEAVVRLLGERFRVGLLTDGPARAQRSKLDRLGWTDLFDATVVTGDLGAPKPDRGAFDALLDALEATPAETVYVGDDPERDVAGAARAGMATVHVRGPDQAPAPAADAVVSRDELAALPGVIAALGEDGA